MHEHWPGWANMMRARVESRIAEIDGLQKLMGDRRLILAKIVVATSRRRRGAT